MYLKSSEIVKLNGKNYLRIYLKKEYPYSIKLDGNDVDMLSFVFREPEFSDMGSLMNASLPLEKLYQYSHIDKSIARAALGTEDQLQDAQIEILEKKIQIKEDIHELSISDKEKLELEQQDFIRRFMVFTLFNSSDLDQRPNGGTDFFAEILKLFEFLDKVCFREHGDEIPLKTSLKVLDKFNGISLLIKQELLIEYLAFFFSHFPFRSLHMLLEEQRLR